MRPRLRIGVIGVGRRGREHLETLAVLRDRYDLVAVCDLSESAAQAAAGSAGVSGYSNLKEFFGRESLDVVVIATPPETHHLVAKMAADHGVHMLIETPLGQTRRMMDFTCEAVARAGVKAEAAENMWRRPQEQLSRMALDAGLIGRALRVSSYYDDAADNNIYHTVSRMRMFADAEVDEVKAYSRAFKGLAPTRTGPGAVGEEQWTHALLSFSNGIVGSCTYVNNWTGPLRGGHPRFFSVEGTEGFVVTGLGAPNMLRRVEGGRAVDYPLQIELRQVGEYEVPGRFFYATDPQIEWLNPFADRMLDPSDGLGGRWDGSARAAELDSLHRAVSTDGEPSYTLARARRDQELSILMTESARRAEALPGQVDHIEETVWEREQDEVFRRRWGFDPFDVNAFMSSR